LKYTYSPQTVAQKGSEPNGTAGRVINNPPACGYITLHLSLQILTPEDQTSVRKNNIIFLQREGPVPSSQDHAGWAGSDRLHTCKVKVSTKGLLLWFSGLLNLLARRGIKWVPKNTRHPMSWMVVFKVRIASRG
jgi:hypothetical protein